MTLNNIKKNDYDNALIVMHNSLARKQTKWTINEQKLFYAFISQVQSMTHDYWLTLDTRDILNVLNMDTHNYDRNELNDLLNGLKQKSEIIFKLHETFDSGYLIINVKATPQKLQIRFNDYYLPLIKHLEKQFTMFKLKNLSPFKSKYSLLLYTDIKSRYNPLNLNPDGTFTYGYDLEHLKYLFGISDTDYVRVDKKTNKTKFDTYNFKKYTIDRAISEINSNPAITGMKINYETVKYRKEVKGYLFTYILVDENGYAK